MKYITYLILILCLIITNNISPKIYKGAELRTKTAYTYGRFEVRYKAAEKDGVLASFFTYHEITSTSNWNELDIEIMGRYNNDVQFNAITPGQTNHVRHQNVNFNPCVDFHDYAIEWTPDYVAWFIDGEMVYKQTGAHVQTLNRAQKIMMNIWNPASEGWAGVFNPNSLPAFAYYDYVKYYSYTPGSGNYGTNNNFTLLWADNFDSFNPSRWEKATHTFDGNNCDFIQENVVYKDGYMILCLTDGTNIGYTDKVAPTPMWARYEYNNVFIRFNEDLNKLSAETLSNYLISGVTINSALLLDDKKTVKLNVSGFNQSITNNLILMNIKDDFIPANTMSPKAITITNSNPLTFPIKINVGGNAALGYLPDIEYKYNTEYGYSEGTSASASSAINILNTEEDEIYRSERYYITKYDVRVPNGIYKVTLKFCENYFTSSGSRVFDVFVQNQLKINNLDIYAKVGKNTAYDEVINDVVINDGLLKIHFSAEVGEPLINGIVVEQISTGIDETEINKTGMNFKLYPNYPNPFNGFTKIPIELKNKSDLDLRIYNILGEEKYSRNLRDLSAGLHEISWGGEDNYGLPLSSGVYIVRVSNNYFSDSRKIVYLK
jgi:hypothetical protein